jgi:integrase
MFTQVTRKGGFPDRRFHDLRHSAATILLVAGVHPKLVQERMGHTTIVMTMDIYSHVLPSMQREVAEKIDEMLKQS